MEIQQQMNFYQELKQVLHQGENKSSNSFDSRKNLVEICHLRRGEGFWNLRR